MNDPVRQLEHDHRELNRMVTDLKERLTASRDVPSLADARASYFVQEIETLCDALISHFAREEEGLFLFVVDRLPELKSDVERILSGHDAVCGALTRLSRMTSASSLSKSTLRAHFERFEAAYAKHTREELELLRIVGGRLGPEDRRELAKLSEGL